MMFNQLIGDSDHQVMSGNGEMVLDVMLVVNCIKTSIAGVVALKNPKMLTPLRHAFSCLLLYCFTTRISLQLCCSHDYPILQILTLSIVSI